MCKTRVIVDREIGALFKDRALLWDGIYRGSVASRSHRGLWSLQNGPTLKSPWAANSKIPPWKYMMKKRYLVILAILFALGCSEDPDTNNGNGTNGQDDAGGLSDTESNNNEVDGHCPTAVLPGQTSVSYDGSTIGNENLFESNRLEWGDAGDDALLYVVPETGTYEFFMEGGATQVSGCGVSIYERHGMDIVYFTPDICPEEGQVRDLPEAYFVAGEGFEGTAELTEGQQLLLLVSCASWSTPETEVEYTITIELQ